MEELVTVGCHVIQLFLGIGVDVGDVLLDQFLVDQLSVVYAGLLHLETLV